MTGLKNIFTHIVITQIQGKYIYYLFLYILEKVTCGVTIYKSDISVQQLLSTWVAF